MSIGKRLILTFLAMTSLPLLFIILLNYLNASKVARENSLNELFLVAEGKEAAILEFISSKKSRAVVYAGGEFITSEVERITAIPDRAGRRKAASALNEHLRNNRRPLDPDIAEIHILDLNGLVIGSTDEESLGSDVDRNEPYFLKGRNAPYIQDFQTHAHHGHLNRFIAVAAPVRSSRTGKVIGVLMNGYRDLNFGRLLSGERTLQFGAGTTFDTTSGVTEIYLVNREGFVITPSKRYQEHSADSGHLPLEGQPHVRQCIEQGEETSGEWADHQGKAVFGSTMCMKVEDDWRWALVVEKDRGAALAQTIAMRRQSAFIGFFTLSIVGLIGFVVSRSISDPIRKLHEGVSVIGGGNMDHRVATDSRDEIGGLSRAFDAMVENIRKVTASRDELDREVGMRKKTEEMLMQAELKYRTLFEQSPDGVLLVAPDTGIALEFNDAACRNLGYSREEFAGLRINDYEVLENPEETRSRIATIMQKGEDTFETRHRTKSGEARDVLVSVRQVEISGVHSFLCIFRDITERKRALRDLEDLAVSLERSNEELQQFAYIASHDLQEPLRMVSSYTQLLAERYNDRLDEKAKKYIHYAVDGAVRMQKLINDLLTYSRVGTKGRPPEPVETQSALGEALRNLTVVVRESGAEITNDTLPTINADRSQLVQLFQNLIANAVKFRGKDVPRIHISARESGSEWVFSVRDNGIGIDPQYADKIFVIFQRLHTKEEYPGTGIGLAVCKKIVERHGGRIWFESEPDKGTTFYFTMPK